MTVIPNPPTLGAKFTNDTTGVSYEYDGEKWVITSTPGSEQAEEIGENLADLTSRVADGETTQGQIQETIADALSTQSTIQGNIIELEEEIESLAPSLDRGKWNLAEFGTGVTLAAGEYAMGIGANRVYCEELYADCLAAIDGNPNNNPEALNECNRLGGDCFNAVENGTEYFMNDWSHATFLHFHKIDSEGKEHTFSDYEVGMFIDLFDQGDTGFAVFEITAAPTLDGNVYTIGVTPIQHEGEASGLARIKVFELSGADPTDFVRKAGDSMTGQLSIYPKGNKPAFYVYPSDDVTENTYCIRQFGQPYLDEDGNKKRDTVFYTTSEGYPSIHADHSPINNKHLTPKKYVDDTVKKNVDKLYYPARFSWRAYTETSAGPAAGEIQFNNKSMSSSTEVRINFKSYDGRLDLYDVDDSTVVYSGPTNSSMMLTGYYIGSDTDNKWKWKGTANITKITVYKRTGGHYFKCDLGSYKTFNDNFSNSARYYFTIPGLF